ncbi:hypothetical protein PM082_015137 [Marasmius tenuissimus]|nr:hypothetical protein PM082_015137 [Marasmius tenuissimus]
MPSGACLNSTVHDESLFPADPMEPPSSSSSSSSASSSESSNKPIHSLNCFILFRSEFCKESNLQGESHPGAQLSKRAAIAWKQLAPEEKKPWRNLASLKKRQHKSEQKCAKTSRSFHEVRSAGAGDDELKDEEEERDPNDIVHRRVVTATPTLKQQFLPLFNNSHYPDHKVFEWKETHRNEKCERCATLGLPCTSNLGDRKLVCHECNSTNTKKCSRLNNFRKEFIMKKMGINEPLWEVLKEAFLEDKSQKTIQKRIEKARHMEEAEEQGTEEDELDSNLEDEPQGIATSTKRDSGTRDKRKHMTVDDGGFISRSIPNSPPAKKGKVMPEVVINKSILKKIKSREHKNSKAAGSKNVKRSKSSTKTNTNLAERNTSDVASIVEPADTGDVVSGSKRPRGPTIKAKIAEAEHRKRRKLAENDTILDLDTHGHGHGSSIDAPIATAAINTKSAPTGATTGVKASSS